MVEKFHTHRFKFLQSLIIQDCLIIYFLYTLSNEITFKHAIFFLPLLAIYACFRIYSIYRYGIKNTPLLEIHPNKYLFRGFLFNVGDKTIYFKDIEKIRIERSKLLITLKGNWKDLIHGANYWNRSFSLSKEHFVFSMGHLKHSKKAIDAIEDALLVYCEIYKEH